MSCWMSRQVVSSLLRSAPGGQSLFLPGTSSGALQSFRCIWNEGQDRNTGGGQSFYDSTVEEYALQPPEVLSLNQMLEFGRAALYDGTMLLKSARHAQRELPKRLARRLMDLQLLPYIVVSNPHIKRVYDSYHHAFNVLRATPSVRSVEQNEEFTTLLLRLVDEHAPMLDALAAGLREVTEKPFVGDKLRLDGFLDGMLRSRISRRVIAEQHINLHNRRPGYIGVICTDLRLLEATDFAAQRCRQVCTETYGTAPDVVVAGDTRATAPYIPNHLDYMLYELLKNSMRAVVEAHPNRAVLPPVHVHICEGERDVTIRIADQGRGIPEEHVEDVWKYGYTTVPKGVSTVSSAPVPPELLGAGAWAQAAGGPGGAAAAGGPGGAAAAAGGVYRMGGLGFGLPMSRLYARYFGGGLQLVNIPGYGVDAYLTLKRLEGEWREDHVEESQALLLQEELAGS